MKLSIKRSGFTLIELLVVIAIIAILAAILFPVFAQAREKARQTACLSNMKQVGLGVQMYSQDYDETMPPIATGIDGVADFGDPTSPNFRPNYLGSLLPYIKSNQIFHCPSAVITAVTPLSDTSYIGNAAIMGRTLAVVPAPADIVYLQEIYDRRTIAYLRPGLSSSKTLLRSGFPDGTYFYWHYPRGVGQENYTVQHQMGGNLVFADGHAKWRRGESMRSGDFGLVPATDTWSAPVTKPYTAAF